MIGPIDVRASAHRTLTPLAGATLDGGYWAALQRLNRERLLPDAPRRLEAAGNFENLRAAAGRSDAGYRGPVFMDSDVYKWLEAVGWELAREPSPELAASADAAIELIEAAQGADGYLNSYYQVAAPGERYANLAWDHELYCAGHLIQAAVAHARGRGDERLLAVARRFADQLDGVFGPGRRDGAPGHPEIELALVELARLTGERRYLELARRFVDARGRATLQPARFGSSYFQDRVPVREQDEVEGHAVRACYLGAGVTDVYLETGEPALLAAMRAQWHDMAARKAYLTGGIGAHHLDEAFGDAFELPPDRCYGETCAAIASVLWSWRLLLATGEARYADLLERTLYNGVMVGLALDGGGFSYANPLHVRDGHRDPVEIGAERRPWRAGERLRLALELAPRLVFPHPRIDAVRGCAAIERGPLVYCVEAADLPAGVGVDELALDPGGELRAVAREDLLGGIVAIGAAAARRGALADAPWPYAPVPGALADGEVELALLAVPYSHWGNRGAGAMRVWLPLAD